VLAPPYCYAFGGIAIGEFCTRLPNATTCYVNKHFIKKYSFILIGIQSESDGGGPLVYLPMEVNDWLLIGVASKRDNVTDCSLGYSPFVRVTEYILWIANKTGYGMIIG